MFGLWRAVRASTDEYWRWFREKAQTPHARGWLAAYSFFEALILPFPTDVFLALMVYADRARVVWITIFTTIASVLGGLAGYAAAYFFYTALIAPLVAHLGMADVVARLAATLNHYAFDAVFLGAFTPIPFTPVVYTAGLLKTDLVAFTLASLIGRGARYALVSGITYFFGIASIPKLGRVATRITIVACALAFGIALIVFFKH